MTDAQKKTKVPAEIQHVYAHLWKHGQYVLLAICDADLLGKTLREGNIVFEVRKNFYEGFKMRVETAIDLIAQSTVVNLVGHHTVRKALERGLIHPEAIITISGIPHAQIVKT